MSDVTPNENGRRDLWIPTLFVLFFVGLAILQGWFVMLAQSTFTGVVTDQAVQTNSDAPAWTATVAFTSQGALAGRLDLAFRDQQDELLAPDRIQATAERTTRFPQSLPVHFAPDGAGHYTAHLDLPLGGKWSIRVVATKGDSSIETIKVVEITP